jgi:hypothetical protein
MANGAGALNQILAADIGLSVSANISALADYDIDISAIDTFRSLLIIGHVKNPITLGT